MLSVVRVTAVLLLFGGCDSPTNGDFGFVVGDSPDVMTLKNALQRAVSEARAGKGQKAQVTLLKPNVPGADGWIVSDLTGAQGVDEVISRANTFLAAHPSEVFAAQAHPSQRDTWTFFSTQAGAGQADFSITRRAGVIEIKMTHLFDKVPINDYECTILLDVAPPS